MRDVNDDMDELFRRAADNYPLNTSGADWNKVQSAMESSSDFTQKGAKRNRKSRLLWLLLFLPLAFAINKYALQDKPLGNAGKPTTGKGDQVASAKDIELKTENTSHQKNTLQKPSDVANPKNKQKIADEVALAQDIELKNENTSHQKNTLQKPSDVSDLKNKQKITDEFADNKTAPSAKVASDDNDRNDKAINTGIKKVIREKVTKASIKIAIANADLNILSAVDDGIEDKKEVVKDHELSKDSQLRPELNELMSKKEIKTETKDTIKEAETPAKTMVAIVDSSKKIGSRKNDTSNKPAKQANRRFYAGIIAGPDISTIKLQKIIKTGSTAGIIAGYQLSKRLSVESGLFADKKYYYTEGKYFSTEKLNIPSYTKIDNVDGYCKMVELPVNIKYNFRSGKKVQWFAVAGASSYFMTKENYSYRYSHYGEPMEKNIAFKESTKIWASVLNLGIGYSHKISNTATLRLEPYIKIPFKTVGVGSLPITSSGLYLGFTKNLF